MVCCRQFKYKYRFFRYKICTIYMSVCYIPIKVNINKLVFKVQAANCHQKNIVLSYRFQQNNHWVS